jgi:hypothetical protein
VLDEYGFRVRGASNQRDRSSSSRAVRFDTFADASILRQVLPRAFVFVLLATPQ